MPVDLAMVGKKQQPIEFTYEERDVMFSVGEHDHDPRSGGEAVRRPARWL
jgi:hypothetical protein